MSHIPTPSPAPLVAAVRYGAVKPGMEVDALEAIQAITGAFVNEHGVRLDQGLSRDQAARLVVDLQKFGFRLLEVRGTDPMYSEPGMAMSVAAALVFKLGGGEPVTLTQVDLDVVAGRVFSYDWTPAGLQLQTVARVEPGKQN